MEAMDLVVRNEFLRHEETLDIVVVLSFLERL
jgi:hypothetical protein